MELFNHRESLNLWNNLILSQNFTSNTGYKLLDQIKIELSSLQMKILDKQSEFHKFKNDLNTNFQTLQLKSINKINLYYILLILYLLLLLLIGIIIILIHFETFSLIITTNSLIVKKIRIMFDTFLLIELIWSNFFIIQRNRLKS